MYKSSISQNTIIQETYESGRVRSLLGTSAVWQYSMSNRLMNQCGLWYMLSTLIMWRILVITGELDYG